MTEKYRNKSMQVRDSGIGRFTGQMDLDAGLARYREALYESATSHTGARCGSSSVRSHSRRHLHKRAVRAIGVAMVLALMMAILAFTGAAQYAGCGPLRLTPGQEGGDLAAYLISLYCADGLESQTRFALLTAGDEDGRKRVPCNLRH